MCQPSRYVLTLFRRTDTMYIGDIMKHIRSINKYECCLPEYLQHDLDAYKEGLKNNSSPIDCLWGELYGSIKAALINDGAITPLQLSLIHILLTTASPQLRCCVWFCRVTDCSRRRFRRTSERIVGTPQHDSYRRPVRARIHPRLDADDPPYLPPESG